jgi:putative SOS response-associated peptidase YedK
MCGRQFDPEEFSELKLNPFTGQWIWNFTIPPRRYNVAPTMDVCVVRARHGDRHVDGMRWGLIPSWAKDMKIGFQTINARSDGLDSKPAFKGAWKAGRRCLIIAGGFYEWRKRGTADKQPFAVTMGNRGLMAFAGLWDGWKDPANPAAGWLRTCTIITTEANCLTAPIHDRMPVILGFEDWPKWLGEDPANENELRALLKPFPSERMAMWAVDKKVGNIKNDSPDLLEPVRVAT